MASQDWFDKDFYKVLGVSKDASDAELKKTYRKLARQFHPDSNPGDAAAENRFKEISEAYSVLSDKEQRQEYDQVRAMGPAPASRRAAEGRAGSRTSSAGCSGSRAVADSASASARAARAVPAVSRTSSAGCSAGVVASVRPPAATAASVGRRRAATSRRRRPSTSPRRSPVTPSSCRRATVDR